MEFCVCCATGSMIERMVVTCGTQAEVGAWMDALKAHVVSNQPQSKPVSVQVRIVAGTLSSVSIS